MRFCRAWMLLAALGVGACDSGDRTAEPDFPPALESRADMLAQSMLIVDTHIDVPYRLNNDFEDVTGPAPGGQFDYPRAVDGGLDAPFMSIYTPADYEFGSPGKATEHADAMIDIVESVVAAAPDKFTIATSVDEVLAAKEAGRIALPLGMENGAPIAGNMALLKHFHDRGIRYITLAHSRSNHLADSSYDEARPNDGLTDFGRDVVREMNALGIMVDVSHISDAAFRDVLETTAVPVVATHSSARHFTPGFERNMSDEMIEALAAQGGVIMINYGSAFLTEDANSYGDRRDAAYEKWLEESGEADSDENRDAFRERYRAENPYPYAHLDDVLDHIDHVVELTGNADHVGIGSDYDGVGDSLPIGLKDVSTYPNLIAGMLERGYSDAQIEKILGGNLLRVWRANEAYAAETMGQTERP